MTHKKDGRKKWTIRQKEQVADIFSGKPPTEKEFNKLERLLRIMRNHKEAEKQRKSRKRKRVWPVKPGR